VLRRGRDPDRRAPRRRRIRKLRLLALLGALLVLGLAAFTFGLLTAIASEIPPLDPAAQQAQEVNGFIYADNGHRILAVLRGSESRTIIRRKDMSPWIRHAVVDVEDRRFYEHRGVDLRGIVRAVWADVRHKAVVEGGSTITQQYVKNVFVKNQRSLARKLREAALAWQLEQRWTKDRILTAYLNTIYFGNGAYGVQQAAETYFGHGARRLSIPEAALLAGVPADPSAYDPVTHPSAARRRRDVVLRAMLDQGDITQADYLAASSAPLPRPVDVHLPGTVGPAQYFVNYVKQQLVSKYGAGTVFGGGLRVKTTIDLELQRDAREAISKWLTDPNGPSAALVAIDPQDGRIRAMIGGNNFRKSQFNLAVQGERQPGSSFKPFVLATALQHGIAPSTTMVSEPVTIDAGGRLWEVHNYEDTYLGTISLEQATIHSDNSVYAQLTKLVGPLGVARLAHRLGISSPLYGYFSIGLGAQAVTPLDMARAFSAFANGGHRLDTKVFGNEPRAIDWVRQKDGHVDMNDVEPVRVLRPETAALVTSLLQGVVGEGTGSAAALPDRPAAGKTGTTEDYGDAWFVGYTPQLVTAVWVGYPNKLVPMTTQYHGSPVAGGTYPALIWKAFMQRALAGQPVMDFQPPPSLYAAPRRVVYRNGELRLDNGYCRNTVEVSYFTGSTPGLVAHCKPNEVDVPRVVGVTLASAKRRLAEQPLTPVLAYKPAKPLQRVGIVLAQYPSRGTLSSWDRVTLVVSKPLHGVVPRLVGLTLRQARRRLVQRGLRGLVVRFGDGRPGRVVSQAPLPGVAAAPGMPVQLIVGRGR
jgi:penicillin-binding protein 1A